jgi:hypothetical protein
MPTPPDTNAHMTASRLGLFALSFAALCTACSDPGTDPTGPGDTGAATETDDGPADDGSGSGDPSEDDDAAATGSDDAMDDGADTTGGPIDPEDPAALLFSRLPGLWVAPVTSNTSAGDFATMNMDIRPADDRTLFSRVDLDSDNNLRFAFAIETHDGEDVLVFRNGGFFQGVLRDTRTRLEEHDPEAGTWRFCAIAGGCAYVDARFTLQGDDHLELEAIVLRMQHMHWAATKAEPRELAEPFPFDDAPGSATDPFPEMPGLTVTLDWSEPAEPGATAWVILTTTPCGLSPAACTPARFIRAETEEGATSAELRFDQIHAGDYHAIGILDRNGNLGATLLPDGGDGVTLPDQPVTVAPTGESDAALVVAIDL